LGLVANWPQFTLLVLINAFVGAMVGLERVVLPLMAQDVFGLASRTAVLSFIVTFGMAKAFSNLAAGRLADRLGRRPVLILGWLFGLPVPPLIIFAPAWEWVVFANILLGINQGLCWSTTIIMKIDLVGPRRRGLAMGLNEFGGYVAVSLAALATGYLIAAYGPLPVPLYPGIAFALLGLLLSLGFVRETQAYAQLEAGLGHQLPLSQSRPTPPVAPKGVESPGVDQGPASARGGAPGPSFARILLLTSWKDRALFAASQAGMVNNLNDGMVWGLLPLFLADAGLPVAQVGIVAATYPGVWGLSQLATGALSDRWGRKGMIASGMWVQAGGIGLLVSGQSFGVWMAGAVLLGLGTALVYPTLLAVVSDVVHPQWRASAVGVYRLWRDSGYAVGAVTAGLLADALGIPAAMAVIGGLTFLSGVVVAAVMYETLPARRKTGV
jgi:MFS family permease